MPDLNDFYAFLCSHKITPTEELLTEKRVKYKSLENADKKDASSWYFIHEFPDGQYCGRAGDFRLGLDLHWHSYSGAVSDEDKRRYREEQKRVYDEFVQVEEEKREYGKTRAKEDWDKCVELPQGLKHGYLESKGLSGIGLRYNVSYDAVVAPIYSLEGLISLVYYFPDGSKRNLKGANAKGFCLIGDIAKARRLVFTEGWSDAATIHECTGDVTVACFGANNVIAQACLLRDEYKLPVCLARDLGEAGDKLTEQWKTLIGGEVFTPTLSDFNEVYLAQGKDAVKALISVKRLMAMKLGDFLDKPVKKLTWVIENYLLESSVHVTYGGPGCGKSYYLLHKALMIATGKPFLGKKTIRARVLYIDAELGEGLIQPRLVQLCACSSISKDEVNDWFTLYSFDMDFDLKLMLTSEESRTLLKPLIDEHDVIVFDNYLKLVPGCDYDKQHHTWRVVYEWLQGLSKAQGKTVLLAHHTPKSGLGMMGSSQMGNDIDYSMYLAKPKVRQDHLVIEVEYDKTRSIEPRHLVPFTLHIRDSVWYEKKDEETQGLSPWDLPCFLTNNDQ